MKAPANTNIEPYRLPRCTEWVSAHAGCYEVQCEMAGVSTVNGKWLCIRHGKMEKTGRCVGYPHKADRIHKP